MRRRDLMALIACATAWPRLASAQTANKLPVIGYLALNVSEQEPELIDAFRDALAGLGYVEGKTATIVGRHAAGNLRALNLLAKQVAALRPDVILADTATPIKAMRAAAPDVPIVGALMGNPIAQGLVASFAHPGGNVTGIAADVEELRAKLLELALEAIAGVKAIGLLRNPEGDNAATLERELRDAAAKHGIALHAADARTPDDIAGAIEQLSQSGAAFFYVQANGVFNSERYRIGQLALARHLPGISDQNRYVPAGLLMSYGVKTVDNYRRAAVFIDKILKGAKPADLPVEFPTRVVLTINLKTAKALGITLSQSLLLRADEVIE
jgi:putative tryptophan/tyrosine transport system substrate-binding protein